MAEVVCFPGEPRSEFERALGAALAKAAAGKLPKTLLDAMRDDLWKLFNALDNVSTAVSGGIPGPLTPEQLAAIEDFGQRVREDVGKQVVGKALEERVRLWIDGRLVPGR